MTRKLNKVQLELLKAFSTMDDADFPEFKSYFLKFHVTKLQDHMVKTFKEKGINPEVILTENLRTPYSQK